ncbi:hypothetical protein ITP53_17565 [Nonomuraea sp. K274]|uniref:Uncharacterized protein n=1 Tax=Nonomuraea cypriaca TaxID=1187855 RepID=A0A931ACH0_9ACTN|nr:hypothetical protein [Nonomuraea cypriaca]MBF8187510.1 hypothetical protein [Nonomuraea cypriaca]
MRHITWPFIIAVMAGGLLAFANPASSDVQHNTAHSSTQNPGGKILSPLTGAHADDDHGAHADDDH